MDAAGRPAELATDVNRTARSPFVSFLHYVTFRRLGAFVKGSLKATVAAYAAFLLLRLALGPGFGEGIARGIFPLAAYVSLVLLLLAELLERS